TLAIRYHAELGLSIDGIISATQQFHQVLLEMKEAHQASRNYLHDARGRFVFVASAIDRIPVIVNLRDDDGHERDAARNDLVEALNLIDQHPKELGHLRGHALKMQGQLEAIAGNPSLAIDIVQQAIGMFPDGSLKRAQALAAFANACLDTQRFEEANS